MSAPAFDFYNADFCPFGQRAWIAVLERALPHNHKEVNYFNKGLDLTKEFRDVSGPATVPALRAGDDKIWDSLILIDYLEDKFPPTAEHPSLYPESPADRWRARDFISRWGGKIVPDFYRPLFAQTPEDQATLLAKVEQDLKDFSADLEKISEGPFVFGDRFTVADIAFVPFIERMEKILIKYRNLTVPPENDECARLRTWYAACKARPSVATTMADRTEASLTTQPFGAKERTAYLQEVYLPYAHNATAKGKELLANAPPGVTSITEANL